MYTKGIRRVFIWLLTGFVVCGTALSGGPIADLSSRAQFREVPPGAVQWTGGFMKRMWDRNAEVTIPYLWERYQSDELAGYFLNFEKLAAGSNDGFLNGDVNFVDGDFYKWLEAICYLIAQDDASEWSSEVDRIVEVLAACQRRAGERYGDGFEGFLSTYTQLSDREPFGPSSVGSEVYCMGHLMSLAAVHHRVTGKTNLLTLAERTGDLLWRTTQKQSHMTWLYWDHAAILGALDLYRETQDRTYFDLAQYIVDSKGAQFPHSGQVNWNIQDNGPLLEQTQAIGHAQRANYLYAGAADLFLMGGNAAYRDALAGIWQDIVDTKLYVTGGTGSIHGFDFGLDGWHPQYPNPPGEPKADNTQKHVTEAYGPSYYTKGPTVKAVRSVGWRYSAGECYRPLGRPSTPICWRKNS